MNLKKLLIIVSHVLFWAISFYLIVRIFGVTRFEIDITDKGESRSIVYDNTFIYSTIFTLFISIVIYYTNLFFSVRKFFKIKNVKILIGHEATLIGSGIALIFVINKLFFYSEFRRWDFPSMEIHLLLLFIFTGFSFLNAFVEEWARNEIMKRKLIEEKLSSELTFLKSQVNPHFLFNALNTLFSMAQKIRDTDLERGIMTLSKLMRYMIYDSNATKVSISKEIDHLDNYIEIQKLRLSEEDDVVINFEKKGRFDQYKIAPLILIPFIENAFKHGVRLEERSIISIQISVDNYGVLSLDVSNKCFNDSIIEDERYKGLGLDNVRRRLELLYPNRYQLDIENENQEFHVSLNVECNGKD